MPSSENFDPGRIKTLRNQLYGIKITLKSDDTFAHIVGDDWHTVRWYSSASERDKALKTLGIRHKYSRLGDQPTLIYEPVQRESADVPQIGQHA